MSQTATFTAEAQISRVTRLAIAEAGLATMDRKARPWMILSGALFILVAAVAIMITGMGRSGRHAAAPAPGRTDAVTPGTGSLQGVVSPREADRIRSTLLGGQNDDPIPLVPIEPDAAPGPENTAVEHELLAIYQELDNDKHEVRPRLPAWLQPPAAPVKHEVSPVAPGPVTDRSIDTDQVRQVIRENFRGIARCHQRQLKRDPDATGRVDVTAVVDPSGKVTNVRVTTPRARGTFLDDCLVQEIRSWRFPATKGSTRTISIPLLLLAR